MYNLKGDKKQYKSYYCKHNNCKRYDGITFFIYFVT